VDLIQYLPRDQAAHVYIDVTALRSSGLLDLLAGSKTEEESEYRHLVERTGFDYRMDMDAVAAAFMRGSTYLVVRGRFDWKRLSDYARSENGSCRNTVCLMPGSSTEKRISFYPLKSNILALAISSEERGSDMIGPNQWPTPPRLPSEPVWISIPSYMFSDVTQMPSGTHSFLSPLAQAQQVTFAIGPRDQRLEIRMDVTASSPQAAESLAKQLTSTTDLLQKMITRQHMTPNAGDLSGVLVSGRFEQQDRRVTGSWPVERRFVEALASGKVQ
jgi:hypothetical protein